MDHTTWIQMQQHPPNPNPSIDPYAQFYNTQSSSLYTHYPYNLPQQSQIQNPNPNPNFIDTQTVQDHQVVLPTQYDASLWQSYAQIYSNQQSYLGVDAQTNLAYGLQQSQLGALGVSATTSYQDPNVVTQTWQTKSGIHHYGADPVSYTSADARPLTRVEPIVHANPTPVYWNNPVSNPVVRRPTNGAMRKFPKKTKIVQSAWCEICKIDCTSNDVLLKHRVGKKHKKNLEKLEEAKRSANATLLASVPVVINPVNGLQQNISTGIQHLRKEPPTEEDLETKRRKIMEGGAAADAVRVCAICNVVCNSETVLNYHLAGQKHATMVKKRAAGTLK